MEQCTYEHCSNPAEFIDEIEVVMNISKKQFKFIELVERCGYLLRTEIDKQQYPDSMINALIEKRLIFERDGMIASTTG